MIKDATVNRGKVGVGRHSGGVARDRNSKTVINRILQLLFAPVYRSVVWTEAWPSRNRICSSSPLQSWQGRAQVRRRSWGAKLAMPACRAHRLTAYQTTFAVTPAP